jgi:hypothetical protein
MKISTRCPNLRLRKLKKVRPCWNRKTKEVFTTEAPRTQRKTIFHFREMPAMKNRLIASRKKWPKAFRNFLVVFYHEKIPR